jgi:ZIP family zinc transporter
VDSVYLILIIAASGPIIGSLIGVIKKPSDFFIYNMLAFAAGVMLTISFLNLIPGSIELSSIWLCSIGIIIGSILMYALDRLIPHVHPSYCIPEHGRNLQRTALYLLLGIFMHNFPEGMAIATGTVSNFNVTLSISIAIAVHNIPEGICTSAPYYHFTKKKLKSFLISSSTAIPLVIGFLIAYILFKNIPVEIVGIVIAATAGLMIYISADELIPMVHSQDRRLWSHSTIFSLMAGVLFVIILGTI